MLVGVVGPVPLPCCRDCEVSCCPLSTARCPAVP